MGNEQQTDTSPGGISCFFARKDKAIVQEAMDFLDDAVFSQWIKTPKFFLLDGGYGDDEVIQLFSPFDEEAEDMSEDVEAARDALDLAEAFILGYIIAKNGKLTAYKP